MLGSSRSVSLLRLQEDDEHRASDTDRRSSPHATHSTVATSMHHAELSVGLLLCATVIYHTLRDVEHHISASRCPHQLHPLAAPDSYRQLALSRLSSHSHLLGCLLLSYTQHEQGWLQ